MTAVSAPERQLTRTLSEITQLLESDQNSAARLRMVLERLAAITPYDQCALLQVTDNGARFMMCPEAQQDEQERVAAALRRLLDLLTEPDTTADAVQRSLASHRPASEASTSILAAMGWRSHLAVPLVTHDRVMGLLAVGRWVPEAYDEEDLRVLAIVAAQIAAYASALATREQAHVRLLLLAQVGALLDSSLEYETTLQQVAELCVPDLADCCIIAMATADQRIAITALASNLPPADHENARNFTQHFPLRPDAPIGAAYALRTGQAQVIPMITETMLRAAAWDDDAYAVLREAPCTSLIAVPLVVRGRTLGAIEFMRTAARRPYGEEDLPLAEELAERGAAALDNARLHREALEARDLVTRLQRLTARLSAATTSDDVAAIILTHGLEVLGANSGVLSLLSTDAATLRIVRVVGHAPEIVKAWKSYPADRPSPINEALRDRAVVVVESREEYQTRYAPDTIVEALEGSGAWAAVPLLTDQRVVGGARLELSYRPPI